MKANKAILLISLILFSIKCKPIVDEHQSVDSNITNKSGIELVVLGTVQDGGSPHIGCIKDCCSSLFKNPDYTRKIVSLGIIDYDNRKTYMIEASPDFTSQMADLLRIANFTNKKTTDGIFITHAHIGHYTGLMFLGREALGASGVPVYAMPAMTEFLTNNGPWSQLVSLYNISIKTIFNVDTINLGNKLNIIPCRVPHRDEYSETVGFEIIGPNKKVLFIPDIDKWHKWEIDINKRVQNVDYAFLDATFYSGNEINNRDISEIPHPFVIESFEKFDTLSNDDKSKIHFIHLNHTNPLLNSSSREYQTTLNNGFNIATYHQKITL